MCVCVHVSVCVCLCVWIDGCGCVLMGRENGLGVCVCVCVCVMYSVLRARESCVFVCVVCLRVLTMFVRCWYVVGSMGFIVFECCREWCVCVAGLMVFAVFDG